MKLIKYLKVYQLSFTHALKNYKALIGLSIFLITCMTIFSYLWKVAAARAGGVSFSPDQLLWYIAFNEWIIVSIPHIHEDMQNDLKSGRLAYLLPRPISYLGATFAEALGTLSVNLIVLGTVTFLFTWYQVDSLPFEPIGLFLSIILGIAAGIVAILFQMTIGLSAFWLHEVDPIYWLWEKLLFMFGGLMLPLAVYPIWLQKAAQFTPFPALLGQRSALAIDYNWHAIAALVNDLALWGAIATLILLIVYQKGLRVLNIEGG